MAETTIAVIGLGYVGLPLAVEFARYFPVIGLNTSKDKVKQLEQGIDPAGEISTERIKSVKIHYTIDPTALKKANFLIIAVPTPITENKEPDLSAVKSASKTVGENLSKGSIVVYESTVYPGVTEEICIPILEQASGMECGKDFWVGYSPERINPGDKEHYLTKIVKIVAGQDMKTTEKIAAVYEKIVEPGVYKASSIRVAEAAKVIENTQRDLNIALMNELALIFARMGISTKEVIDAAATKWNFHKYVPGLVGGHCISVDPHYLLYKAKQLGYEPKVILAGRGVNDYMPKFVAEMIIETLEKTKTPVEKATVLVLGLTFKENIKDTRNSKIKHTIKVLKEKGVTVLGQDPFLNEEEIKAFQVEPVSLENLPKVDCIILARNHKQYGSLTLAKLKQWMKENPILIDLSYRFTKQEAAKRKEI